MKDDLAEPSVLLSLYVSTTACSLLCVSHRERRAADLDASFSFLYGVYTHRPPPIDPQREAEVRDHQQGRVPGQRQAQAGGRGQEDIRRQGVHQVHYIVTEKTFKCAVSFLSTVV